MKDLVKGLLTLAILAGVVVGVYYWKRSLPADVRPAIATQSSAARVDAQPRIQYPIAPEPAQPASASAAPTPPLPKIDESDPPLVEALGRLFGKARFESLFVVKDIVRRIVVTVDNMTRPKQVTAELSPLQPIEPGFRVTSDETTIDQANFKRYAPVVDLVRSTDAKKLVAVYRHYYPLFQSAYDDLGNRGYFNDRLVDVIESLLAAPDPSGSIKVVRPDARSKYKFVDDSLEGLSAGQKILVRMGEANEKIVKGKLRQLNSLLKGEK